MTNDDECQRFKKRIVELERENDELKQENDALRSRINFCARGSGGGTHSEAYGRKAYRVQGSA